MPRSYDIVVSGGGIAGLIAATCFGNAGFSVLCIDPAQPVTGREDSGADLRTTAFLQPARQLLQQAGLWTRFAPHATPLQIMRIVDAGGSTPDPRIVKDFDASDLDSDLPFGWNLPNWLLRRETLAQIDAMQGVEFRSGLAAQTLFTRADEARVGLSDGTTVTCRLVIGADGRNSPMRQAAGIGVKTTRFGQKALAFAVTHPIPHQNVSTEVHRSGGPFTLVPLPDWEGKPSSAVVWMERGPEIARLASLSAETFNTAMTERSAELYGPLTLASQRTQWPIIAQEADRLTAERIALIAEAAHVVPPIGAQGLNMSLRDLVTLIDLAVARPDELGDRNMLDAYQAARMADIRIRVAGITMLNRISMFSARPLRNARAFGLGAIYSLGPVRRMLMQMGLGAR